MLLYQWQYWELTRAVTTPIAQPRRKEPKNIPTKDPIDLNSAPALKLVPSPSYSSTDLIYKQYYT